MKKQILIVAAIIGFTFLTGGANANAQTHSRLTANVPFDFYLGDRRMPAGDYTIESVNPQSDGATLVFRHKDGKDQRVVNIIGKATTKPATAAKLFFNRYGAEYCLSGLQNPNENFSGQTPRSKVEANLARQFSNSGAKTVAVKLDKK